MILSASECLAWIAVLLTESVAIVTLNLVTIIVFMKTISLRKRSMYLVINLAVVDMLVGGLSASLFVLDIGTYNCNFWNINLSFEILVRLFFPLTSLISIAATSLERMHSTFRPFRHRVIKRGVFVLIITVIWVTGFLTAFIGFHLIVITLLFLPFSVIVCLFITSVSYTSIAVKMSGRCCWVPPQHHGAANREKKLTMTLFLMTLVSLIMWLPFSINVIVVFYLSRPIGFRLSNLLLVLMSANSLMNPILYAIRMPEFKRAIVSLFRCRPQQRQEVMIPLRVM